MCFSGGTPFTLSRFYFNDCFRTNEDHYLQLLIDTDYKGKDEVFVDRDPTHFGFIAQVIRDPFTPFDIV